MEIVHGLPQAINPLPTVLTIGVFDGVHLGHKHLIGSAVKRAHWQNFQSSVLTFDPHPDMIVHPERARPWLTSLEERAELIAGLGVDLLIVQPFTRDVMALTAREFMRQVCGSVVLRELWIGWDFALGRQRTGNVVQLTEIGHDLSFSLHPVDRFTLEGATVSSTSIRAALESGDVEMAALLLGRRFSIRGQVVQGDQRGRTIGFPTANVMVDSHHMLPGNGVYICDAQVGDQHYGAVTNIGVRPTFNGTRRTVEAYLLDFAEDIYGETLRLTFRHRLREERRFNGIAELVTQITHDVSMARAWISANRSS